MFGRAAVAPVCADPAASGASAAGAVRSQDLRVTGAGSDALRPMCKAYRTAVCEYRDMNRRRFLQAGPALQRDLHGFDTTILDEPGRVESPDFRSYYRAWFWSEMPNGDPDATGLACPTSGQAKACPTLPPCASTYFSLCTNMPPEPQQGS
jgi:hypothetical protein